MKKKDSKGQAALEFMMTYGWMLLVLTVAISGLVYFMPNTRSMTTNKCVFGAAMPCLGARLASDNLTIVLRNAMGQSLYNISVNVTVPMNVACSVSNSTLRTDEKLTIICQNSGNMNLSKDTRMNMLVIYKKTRTGYDQTLLGEIYAKYN